MVEKEYIIRFLRDLRNNNSKEWMDENREHYETMKERWLYEIQLVLDRLAIHNSAFEKLKAKDTVHRINNNRMFHPDKPVYKDSLSCSPAGTKTKGASTFFFMIGLEESFIGGGLYRPDKEILEKVRSAIDYNGEELIKIIEDKKFISFFGGLNEDDQKLITSPQNYDKNHKYIDLLNRKNFTATKHITQEEFCGNGFVDLVEEVYLNYQYLDKCLIKAIS
jgi:uncharacterized protein (TIGR02453 family)